MKDRDGTARRVTPIQRCLWPTALISIAFAFGSAFFLASKGIREEGLRSMERAVFTVLGDRAIQLDRLNRVVVTDLPRGSYPVPDDVRGHPDRVTCSSHITIREFDPSVETMVNVVLGSDDSISVLLLYSGQPPDFKRFISGPEARTMFGRNPPIPMADSHGQKGDFTPQFDSVLQGKSFSWRSVICETFTFTKISEITKGK